MSQFTLGSLLKKNANIYPNNIAFASKELSLTYKEANDEVNRIVHWLADKGIKKGDRIAVLMENKVSYGLLIFAIAKIGAILVPVNIRLHPKEINYILNDCAPKLLVTSEWMHSVAASCAEENGLPLYLDNTVREEAQSQETSEPDYAVDAADYYTIKYTSGTTGFPKGCVATHQNWLWGNNNYYAALQIKPEDSYLAILPIFHVAGIGAFLSHLHYGGKVVFGSAKFDPEEAYEWIEKEKVTTLFIVEPIISNLLNSEHHHSSKTTSLKNVISMAGLPVQTVNRIEEQLDCEFVGIYGSTEGSSIITAVRQKDNHNNSYGTELPNFEVMIDAENAEITEEGKRGELLLRGPSLIGLYWNNQEKTDELLEGGWLHTGDVFHQYPDGTLKMVDRKKYLIKTGGENVYPSEVEAVLSGHSGIVEVTVKGVPDATWGEAITAYIVLQEGSDLKGEDITLWCRDKLSGYKIPKYYNFLDELPRNHSGKILKEQL